jgi:hypothetical protein
MQEYMCHHPKVPTLDLCSDSESEDHDGWTSDSDCPECEGSEGKSEEYPSDVEDYSQGHSDQYNTDPSYDNSENGEISNPNSDDCTSEADSPNSNSEEDSKSECDDFYGSEEL